jgi:hypothetical protein
MTDKLSNVALAVGLTIASGTGDAFGLIHAAKAWKADRLIWGEVGLALAGFAVGIASYFFVIRYLTRLDIRAPEVQTLGWFAVTISAVAISQRTWLTWSGFDRVVAVIAVAALGWLISRPG